MINSGMKRVIIVRDIPSNMIEEAIFILKPDAADTACKSQAREAGVKGKPGGRHSKANDTLMKEAEAVIDNYIREHNMRTGDVEMKADRKQKFYINLAINASFIGSIALFVFLITRLI